MNNVANYQQVLMDEVRELPEEALPNLLQIVRLFKQSVLLQSRQAALALHTTPDTRRSGERSGADPATRLEGGCSK